jgi:transcriptional regulator
MSGVSVVAREHVVQHRAGAHTRPRSRAAWPDLASKLSGMYLPRHFSWTDPTQIAEFVAAVGSATLVTFDGTRPIATLLPVIWDRPGDADGVGRLLGHIALANPQWQASVQGTDALAIVTGPQAYVSPSWYESKARHGRVVPTWNYQAVHLTGPVTFHRDTEWLRALVTRLTRMHEDGRAQPWAVADAPPQYIDGQLRAIVGVELTVTSIEAKQKISQNRCETDRAGVITGLRAESDPDAAAIAELMAGQLADGTADC